MATKYDKMPIPDIRQEARANAQRVLDTFWDGVLPIDPIRLARRLGADVYTAQLGDDVFGMVRGTPSETTIYLDIDQSPVRMRFTCAHELGHYVERMDRDVSDESEFAEIDRRSDRNQGNRIEIFANEFAGALLMPEDEFRRHAHHGKGNIELSKLFNVSLDAVKIRKMHLGIK